jgi:cytochrome P450
LLFQPNPFSLCLVLSLGGGKRVKIHPQKTLSFSLYTEAKKHKATQIRKKEETWKLHATHSQKQRRVHTTQLSFSFSFFNGPAGPKFMFRRRKTKKKREKKEGYHKMSSNGMSSNVVLQPNPPHLTDP